MCRLYICVVAEEQHKMKRVRVDNESVERVEGYLTYCIKLEICRSASSAEQILFANSSEFTESDLSIVSIVGWLLY